MSTETHFCRWDWCRESFPVYEEMIDHVVHEHIEKAKPIPWKDLEMMRKAEEGEGGNPEDSIPTVSGFTATQSSAAPLKRRADDVQESQGEDEGNGAAVSSPEAHSSHAPVVPSEDVDEVQTNGSPSAALPSDANKQSGATSGLTDPRDGDAAPAAHTDDDVEMQDGITAPAASSSGAGASASSSKKYTAEERAWMDHRNEQRRLRALELRRQEGRDFRVVTPEELGEKYKSQEQRAAARSPIRTAAAPAPEPEPAFEPAPEPESAPAFEPAPAPEPEERGIESEPELELQHPSPSPSPPRSPLPASSPPPAESPESPATPVRFSAISALSSPGYTPSIASQPASPALTTLVANAISQHVPSHSISSSVSSEAAAESQLTQPSESGSPLKQVVTAGSDVVSDKGKGRATDEDMLPPPPPLRKIMWRPGRNKPPPFKSGLVRVGPSLHKNGTLSAQRKEASGLALLERQNAKRAAEARNAMDVDPPQSQSSSQSSLPLQTQAPYLSPS